MSEIDPPGHFMAFEPEMPEPRPPRSGIFAHTSHVETIVETEDSTVNRFLVLGNLMRTVDDLKNEDVRKEGLEILRAIGVSIYSENGPFFR